MAENMWELVTQNDFDEFAIDTAYILNDYDLSSVLEQYFKVS